MIVIFSLFFFQMSMWFGFAMGYAYHYGLFKRIECGVARATLLESKWPFKMVSQKPYFRTTGDACGGEIMPGTNSGGGFGGLFGGRGGGNASENTQADTERGAAAAASSNSSAAGFKAFSGKGTSIGGAPVTASAVPPRYDS